LILCEGCLRNRLALPQWPTDKPEAALLVSILLTVADEQKIKLSEILSSRGKAGRGTQRMWFARQMVMYLMREVTQASFPAIGRAVKRDHSTVMYGCRVIRRRMEALPEFAAFIHKLERQIKSSQTPRVGTEQAGDERTGQGQSS
jgi:chromosomal replication initiation ATPase DnaA